MTKHTLVYSCACATLATVTAAPALTKQPPSSGSCTLQAAADYLGVEIRLLTSRKKPAIMSISPALEKKSSRVLQMSYLGDIHYSPLYTREGAARAVAGGAAAFLPR